MTPFSGGLIARRTLTRALAWSLSPLIGLATVAALATPAQASPETRATGNQAGKQAGNSTTQAAQGEATASQQAAQHDPFDVLIFSKTDGFRHASIPDGIAAIKQLGADNDFTVDATEDASTFTYDNLKQYDAVIWLSTTGNVLGAEQQSAFEKYIKSGGGYVGIHAAADTEYNWPFYGKLVGAYFDSHPAQQEATVHVTDRVHPSTRDLPKSWTRFDEWYSYATNPRGSVHVLAELDESTYDGGSMGADHPISWCQLYKGGRAWYTGMGHTSESYSDPTFLDHILGGIETAAGAVDADCGATNWSNFDQVTLAKGTDEVGEPMGMAVLPDGDVLHSERQGTLFYTTAEGETSVAAEVPVYTHDEEGLQSIALDPNFSKNHWVYVYYGPPLDTPSGDAPETADDPSVFDKWKGYNQLSRFKLDGKKLDLSTEQKILQVNANRGMCCHVGGDIDFGPKGYLWMSTGDDTNPFQSSGYSPLDDRKNRNPAFDARRGAGNTNDLRGSVLRIDVQEDGSYTIPDGNLFAGDDNDKTRGEIYGFGFRNPYRISVTDEGVLYVGNYGPDAGAGDPQRGPGGIVEFDRITEPGFFGWPYCVGKNKAYNDYDFATGESGPKFDCEGGPTNDSLLNDGLTQLPPAVPAWLPYDGNSVPELGDGSESPMGGPVYAFDADSDSTTKFPEYFDGKFFGYEWGRGWIHTFTIGDKGGPLEIDPFFPTMTLTRPMDIEFGPDGSLYVLDYGSGYFGGADDSAVYRIDYVKGDRSPNAAASADPANGPAPLEVSFSSEGSGDPDPGSSITYAWDFDGDDQTDSTKPNPTHTYTEEGEYEATLTVTDNTGKTGTAGVTIVVGNTAPKLTFDDPAGGHVFAFGDKVHYKLTVTDPDGTPVDCSAVQVDYILGHSTGSGSHGHPLSHTTGCEGTIETATTGGHQGANIYGVLHAEYTDTAPAEGVPGLTSEAEIILQPHHKQAEYFTDSSGVGIVEHEGAQSGTQVGNIDAGDWISFEPYELSGVTSVNFRVASGGSGGAIEIHADAPDGPLVAKAQVSNTGGWEQHVTLPAVPVTDPGGTHELFFVFKGDGTGIFDLDAFTFKGPGAGLCENPDADVDPDTEFDGGKLDHCRWQTIVRRNPAHYQVGDGHLRIDTLPGDMYDSTTNANNVILQDAPDGGWKAITKLSLSLDDSTGNEQAGLMVYGSDDNFVKAMLIDVPDVGLRFEFNANVNGSAVFDNAKDRSGTLPEGIEDSAWIKVVSDGNSVSAYWSDDGQSWHHYGRSRSLETLKQPKVGLAAFNGTGQAATFDFFHLDEAQEQVCEPTQPEEGYTSLFNGTQASRQDWTQAGPGGFTLNDNCVLDPFGGMGLYWFSGKKFDAPYSLKLDWKKPGDDNSGVFVGFPDPQDDPWVAVNQGEEIQIDPTDDPENRTGAIYDEQAPDAEKVQQALKRDGEWNTYNIVVEKDSITIFLNGVKVNHWVDDDPDVDLSEGYIGIQNHSDSDHVRFRDIRINTDPDVTAPKVTAELDPPEPNGDPHGKYEGTYNTPVTVSLSATDDDSGVDTVSYRLDGGDWTAYSDAVTVEAAGKHTVAYRATDNAGNTSKVGEDSFEIVPDACPGSDIRDTVVIGDQDSGVDNVDTGDGCTIADLVDADASYDAHGAFVTHVGQVATELVSDGTITARERSQIVSAAARSDVGK